MRKWKPSKSKREQRLSCDAQSCSLIAAFCLPEKKKGAVAVIFLIQFFSSCASLSDMLATMDAESVCTYDSVAFISGELMIWCWVIFTAMYLLTIPLPGVLWRNVHQARYNLLYTDLKSDFSKYYCRLCSNLNCRWFMKPFFHVNKRYISYNYICQ